MSATSRDPEEYARATQAARATRERVAREVAQQVEELIIAGDIMGGRSLVARRISDIVAAERRGDREVLRSAVMDLCVAGGAWIAALDYRPPPVNGTTAPADI